MRKIKINKQNKMAIGFTALMLLPAILHFCIFYIYINSQSFLLAIRDDYGFTMKYLKMFFNQLGTSGSDITLALKNTMIFFVIGNFFMFPLALLFSYLLYKKIAGYKYFRIVFFLPSIISAVVMVTLYKNIINGPISELWMDFTGKNYMPLFLDSSEYALKFILLYQLWLGLAGNMIIYSGTMNRIPMEVIESAKIDGIGFWGELFHMVIPLIWPTLSTMLLLSFVNIFGASGPILLFTQGEYETTTIAYWIFEQSTSLNPDYNYAAAAGLVFTVVQLPIVFLVRYVNRKLDSGVEY
ncbi:MAG: sugar ABC transporter permease [Clostridia bacterium]|nr:sugar ABC transporter permease [Clostridia bacterium]